MKNWIEYYNHKALTEENPLDVSDMHIGDETATQHFLDRQERRLIGLLQPDKSKTLLDLGCSAGIILERLEKYFDHCIGVDLAENTLKIAQKRLPNCTFIHDDITQLNKIRERKFDFVITYGVMQFLTNEQLIQFLATLTCITNPNARVLLANMPNKAYYEEYQAYRRQRSTTRKIIQADTLVWNWIDETLIKENTKDNFYLTSILPSPQIELPFKAFFDCLLIKK